MDTSDKIITRGIIKWSTICITLVLLIVLFGLWGCPQYSVYQQKKVGEAKLAEAQSSRQVAVSEAKAKMESASLLAAADTLRAHGTARANIIIGNSLTESYLRWYWIDGLDKNANAVIYVPTEGNIPIMEATRNIKK